LAEGTTTFHASHVAHFWRVLIIAHALSQAIGQLLIWHRRCTRTVRMNLVESARRRWRRQRRRRNVGRAYDMALEVARLLPRHVRILDVGCGNGFIGLHLMAMLRATVVGLDVGTDTDAPIDCLPYDGRHFPVKDESVDVVLLCYVLHHAQDARLVLDEVNRVLVAGGLAIIYEDIPKNTLDRLVCWSHNLKWRRKTGPCSFRVADGWRRVFAAADFEVLSERPLSRWRNVAHPVSRCFYVLRANHSQLIENAMSRAENVAPETLAEVYTATQTA
jgi:SAM-dependent methyltransferase